MNLDPYHIADLVTRYLQGTLTAHEVEALERWIDARAENRALFEALRDEAAMEGDMAFFDRLDMDAAWEQVAERRRKRAGRKAWWRVGIAAAAACVLVLAGMLWLGRDGERRRVAQAVRPVAVTGNDVEPGGQRALLRLSDGRTVDLASLQGPMQEQDGTTISGTKGELNYIDAPGVATEELLYNVLEVPKAGMYNLTLSDGTKVWMNAMSELRFPTRFGENDRKVFLKGEAYFEVAPDATRPFRVAVNGTVVEVLGTHFNVNSYKAVTTTVLEGAVKVMHATQAELLKPGQQARVDTGIVVEPADLVKVAAWKNGDFYFKSDGIVDIMEQLARWYDLSVVYAGDVPYDKAFNGSIKRDVNLSEVLDILAFATRATFNINDREVTVQF